MKRSVAFLLGIAMCFLCACVNPNSASTPQPSASFADSEPTTGEPQEKNNVPPPLIAHAGGAIYGYRLSNSLEAINNAYANGFRHIELDFECTTDGEYVLIHDWDSMAKRMLFKAREHTREEFLNAETFVDLTLMDLDTLLAWLDTHEDCYIITDAKCDNFPFLQDLFSRAGARANQFIPQVYSYDEYTQAKEIGFDSVILTLYRMTAPDHAELVEFARSQKPWAITIPGSYMDESLVSVLSRNGIYTYTHSINDLSYFEQWNSCGLHGIYTDYFYPAKWPY